MEDILGQQRAVGLLQSALRSGRLHHAYIFFGPEGVGKYTTSLRFARVLLCQDKQTHTNGQIAACGVCPSCQLTGGDRERTDGVDPGPHPDFHVVTKELARFSQDAAVRSRKLTTIPVEVLRRFLIEPVYRNAQLGTAKVWIVDEAHLLNDTGQNLLLKTLEEPPRDTYLILVTDSHDQLLPTIRSRCQQVAFGPLTDDVVSGWLDRQKPDLNATHRQWLLGFACGSLGRAHLAVHYDLFELAQPVIQGMDQLCRGRYPVDLGPQMAQIIDTFACRWVEKNDGSSKEAANRRGAGLVWTVISQQARKKLVELSAHCQGADPETSDAVLTPWLGVIDAIAATERQLAANVNMGLVTDHLVWLIDRSLSGDRSNQVTAVP